MEHNAFDRWCGYAASFIKYKPDRRRVYDELYSHMEDKYDALVASGISLSDAEVMTLRAMGDATDVGRELAKIHKTFWGRVLSVTKFVLVVVLIVFFYSAANAKERLGISDGDSYGQLYWEELKEGNVLYTPDCRDFSDGYAFSVPRAVSRHGTYEDETGQHEYDSFYFTVRSFNILPWIGAAEVREFYAVDSLGNYYMPSWDTARMGEPAVVGNYYRTGILTYEYGMWLENYIPGAEWIDLRYTSCGRDICLRIDLTEGERYEEV